MNKLQFLIFTKEIPVDTYIYIHLLHPAALLLRRTRPTNRVNPGNNRGVRNVLLSLEESWRSAGIPGDRDPGL